MVLPPFGHSVILSGLDVERVNLAPAEVETFRDLDIPIYYANQVTTEPFVDFGVGLDVLGQHDAGLLVVGERDPDHLGHGS